ncbi:MAG: hypothetical protein CMLOHMNK_01824 [Steroidobacteraceae bacterium]|nr:hypothetical protein [Steroidobacteraceae bacterium]
MTSTIGRPRVLTDEQVAEILAWYRSRRTLTQVARQYGVSVSTIRDVVARAGSYKQRDLKRSSEVLKKKG